MRTVLEPHHANQPVVFRHDFTLGGDFATMEFVRTEALQGDFVALVCRVIGVIQKENSWGEPYLELQAVDMAKERVLLRLWLFVADDISEGQFCIIRGLKVAVEKSAWDGWEDSGRRTLECVQHSTAVEDVSHVADIRAMFY